MGVSTTTAAIIGGSAAAAGYAIGYLTSPREHQLSEHAAGGMAPDQLRKEGFVLAKGGWKKKKVSDTPAEELTGDAKKGAALFKAKCSTCHSCIANGPTKQGPNLHNIMGKEAAKSAGFKFTKNMAKSGIVWDDEAMHKWLTNPKAVVKGTSMAFPGFKKETDRADVIAYLHSLVPS